MHPTPDLHVLGRLRLSGGAPEATVPGKRAVELVIRLLMAGGSLPRRDLGARMWPESDPKSREVQLYQCRRKWRDWVGRGDEGCPVRFEGTVIRYAGDFLQCDLATAMASEAAVLARPDDDSAVVRLVSDFVGLMGGQEESALALGSWPDLRAEFLQRAATVLDAGIVSARRLDLEVAARSWEGLREAWQTAVPGLGTGVETGQAIVLTLPVETLSPPNETPSPRDNRAPGETVLRTPEGRQRGIRVAVAWWMVVAGMALGTWSMLGSKAPSATSRPVLSRTPVSVYVHPDLPGEADSEATDIARVDDAAGGWVATGLVQTADEDVDVLTVRVDGKGRPLWTHRWSGPGKDCDRAFDVLPLPDGGVVVAGESYVPAGVLPGLREGWRLLFLRYDRSGRLVRIHRSRTIVRNSDHRVRAALQPSGDVWVAGTSLEGGSPRFLAWCLRKDGRSEEFAVGSRHGELSSIAVSPSGRVFLIGTQRDPGKLGNPRDWAAIGLDSSGRVLWERRIDGDAGGDDIGCEGFLDAVGRLRLFGAVSSVRPDQRTAVVPAIATLDAEQGAVVSFRRRDDFLASPRVWMTSTPRKGLDISGVHEASGDGAVAWQITGTETGNRVGSAVSQVPDGWQVLGIVGGVSESVADADGLSVDALVSRIGDPSVIRWISWWLPLPAGGLAPLAVTGMGDADARVRHSAGDAAAGQTVLDPQRRRFCIWRFESVVRSRKP